jgi:hypothetical protein
MIFNIHLQSNSRQHSSAIQYTSIRIWNSLVFSTHNRVYWRLSGCRCGLTTVWSQMCAGNYRIADVCWRLSNCRCVLKAIRLQNCLEEHLISDVCWKLSYCRCVLTSIVLQMCVAQYRIAEKCWRLSDCRCVLTTMQSDSLQHTSAIR